MGETIIRAYLPHPLSLDAIMRASHWAAAASIGLAAAGAAQNPARPPIVDRPKPSDTEVWTPVPRVVTPGKANADAPSDAVVLFDGRNLDEWVSAKDQSPAKWIL